MVLVHGAWHGAWAWDRVIPFLRTAGVECVALDLPGHGEDRGPFGDLHADAARVGETLDSLTADVVLVGHSYGGAVISEAGLHPAVGHLVYLTAFVLDVGESCLSIATSDGAGHMGAEGRPTLGAGSTVGADNTITLNPVNAAECLYNSCDPATVAWAVARLGPQPLATVSGTPTGGAWRDKQSTYVVCRDDMSIHPDLQRRMSQRCGSVLEWPTDHSPLLCHPELVAVLLAELARRSS